MKRFLIISASLLFLVACGSSATSTETVLSPTATEGKSLSNSNGCASCHGSNYGGGIGPTWKGVVGTKIKLSTGESIVADRAYLVESIKNPGAKRHAGYSSQMPSNNLTDAEIEKIVDFIEALK